MAQGDFGQGFRQGMSVVRDLAGMYVQTSEIFQDRAMRQTAQQVGLETQKALEQIQGPVKLVEQKIADYTSAIGRNEQPADEALAKKLIVELEEARGLAATQKLDLVMNTAATHLGNQYVVQQMQELGQTALREHQMLMARAYQHDQLAEQERQRQFENTQRVEGELDREALTNLEYDRRAQENEQQQGFALERQREQARLVSEQKDNPWERFFQLNQTIEAEMKSKPATWYEKEGRKQNLSGQDLYERMRAEKISDALDADSTFTDAFKNTFRPSWTQPERENPFADKAREIRALQEELYAAGDENSIKEADALEDDALRFEEQSSRPLSERAEQIEEESFLGMLKSIQEKVLYLNPRYSGWKMSEAYGEYRSRQEKAEKNVTERRAQRESGAGSIAEVE